MNNCKFTLLIKPEDIYNKLIPEQRNMFNNIKITSTNLLNSGDIEIECLALSDEVTEYPNRQKLLGDWYITAMKI